MEAREVRKLTKGSNVHFDLVLQGMHDNARSKRGLIRPSGRPLTNFLCHIGRHFGGNNIGSSVVYGLICGFIGGSTVLSGHSR